MKNKKRQLRHAVELTTRSEGDDGMKVIEGYALKWDDRYDFFDDGTLVESFERGSFTDVLKKMETGLKIEHSGGAFASTNNDTLVLREDKVGLAFTAKLDIRDTDANNAYVRTQNGTSKGVSVSFRASDLKEQRDGKNLKVTITKVSQLPEISLVHNPAYPSSEVEARRADLDSRLRESKQRVAREQLQRQVEDTEVRFLATTIRLDASQAKPNCQRKIQ